VNRPRIEDYNCINSGWARGQAERLLARLLSGLPRLTVSDWRGQWHLSLPGPAQIALAWLLAQKPWIVPIPGTTKRHRLEENIGAVDVELTAEDLREIEEAHLSAEGARYAEAQQRMIDR
jgi:hypothetical protein